jgi:hypothetical protein
MQTSQKAQLLHDDAQALALIERIKQKMEETKRAEESSEVKEPDKLRLRYLFSQNLC